MLLRVVAPVMLIAVIATALAFAAIAAGGPGVTALDSLAHDRWLQTRPAAPASPRLLVIVRDAASDARFGSGRWDRAVLARLITHVARAGALAIGVDAPLSAPSAPGRGGAASDALLSQATALAGNVVYPVAVDPAGTSLSSPLQQARAVGHMHAPPDADGTVRRVPLFVRIGDRAVPAFGLAVAAVSLGIDVDRAVAELRIPADVLGRALLDPSAPDPSQFVPFADAWRALEEGPGERLHGLVGDKVVLVLAEPAGVVRSTARGAMSEAAIQASVLNAALTGTWTRRAPLAWALPATLILAALTAGTGLALRGGTALPVFGVLLAAGIALPFVAVSQLGVVLPVVPPIVAVLVAGAGAVAVRQVLAARRLRGLETQMAGVQGQLTSAREALVRQESAVETLEEDLESARAAVERSTGAERDLLRAAEVLRAQLAEARAQEERTRQRLAELDQDLRQLRAAEPRPAADSDAERERLRRRCEEVGIVTTDRGMLAAFRDLEKGARSSLPILLAGEPGTGKELFARAAHRLSTRAAGPFVAVNVAAISPELFESELFGHVKGSFTGAVADRKGYFEQAHGGTIFLDEIGDLRADHQSKLLRVLQEKSFYRVGSTRPSTVDVRVVAASNRDLERGTAEGWFREDLYFRLKGLVLRLPPLRERAHDVPLLAARLLEQAATEAGRSGLALSEAAVRALERHPWPGNVRELQHCLRQAVALTDGRVITPADLRLRAKDAADARPDEGSDADVLARLRRHAFDMQATATALGWDRSTVTQRLKGLGFRALVEAGGDRAEAALALAGDPALSRTVELKLREYHEHLLRSIDGLSSPEAAVAACRRRFKNLPERHFRALEILVRQRFERQPQTTGG